MHTNIMISFSIFEVLFNLFSNNNNKNSILCSILFNFNCSKTLYS